jgi:hypothetical protein
MVNGRRRHSQLLGLLGGAAVGPEAAALAGPKTAVALGSWAMAVEEAEVPVWRSGRWRSRGTGVEELGGSGSWAGSGHSRGGVRADRRQQAHRSGRPSERRRERVGVGQGAWLWLSPLSFVGPPPADVS